MPHSPRIYNNKLYVLESGTGTLLSMDLESNKIEKEFNFGCFVRGLHFYGNVAVIGKSKIRETSKDFGDLNVREGSKFAGLIFYDILEKQIVGGINYVNSVEEIFDVKIIEDAINPVVIANEIEKYSSIMTFPGNKFWRNKLGQLHRLDGPAIEWNDGEKLWYKNGKMHRIDGPAIENSSGSKEWWKNGKKFKNKDTFFRSLSKKEKEAALFSEDFLNG
jgi:hypothetical protein